MKIDLAEKIAYFTRFKGEIIWDKSKPDGTPRKLLDTSKIKKELNWQPSETFDSGLEKTVSWYFEKYISGEK